MSDLKLQSKLSVEQQKSVAEKIKEIAWHSVDYAKTTSKYKHERHIDHTYFYASFYSLIMINFNVYDFFGSGVDQPIFDSLNKEI